MAFLGNVNEHVEETGYWEILGVEDYKNLFDDSLSFAIKPLDMGQSRHLLMDLCIFHTDGLGCAARVTWSIIHIPTRPAGAPPPFPRPLFLERDGVRIQVPVDPLLEPIFYTFHRWRDIILSPRITVAIQFYERNGGGMLRKIRASITMTPLARRRFASCSQIVNLQLHPWDSIEPNSDAEHEEESEEEDGGDSGGEGDANGGEAVLDHVA